MSGVWVFEKNGVMHLVENQNRKVLVHLPTDEVVTSYASLDRKLSMLGWQRYYDNPNFIQYHKPSSIDLISLPKDFHKFNSVHMHDIVLKNSNAFEVRNV